jgi:hypothetical protein
LKIICGKIEVPLSKGNATREGNATRRGSKPKMQQQILRRRQIDEELRKEMEKLHQAMEKLRECFSKGDNCVASL